MKNIYLPLLALGLFLNSNAQYTSNYVENGGNPGGLHNEDEFDGGTSWTSIYDCSSISNGTNIYTSSQTIPFNFEFNGSVVTQFKASNTGYITFDINHTTPASALSVGMLPDNNMPSNSICAWGIYVDNQSGFAKMDTKIIGTTGNRQLWVAFRSFYNPNGTDAFDFTYWAIVLEEGSNNIYVVRQWETDFGGVWEDFPVSVGVQINGTTAVEAAGNPISIDKTNASNFESDNDYWEFTPTTTGTGTKENWTEQFFSISPNPTTGLVHIDLPDELSPQQVNVYSVSGALIYKIDEFKPHLNLSKLKKGIYFITVSSNSTNYTSRLIIR